MVLDLPLGGAKGGVTVDPKKLSQREVQRLTKRYTAAILPIIGPEQDIPAPDVNTDAQTMAWIVDTMTMMTGKHSPEVVTGRPPCVDDASPCAGGGHVSFARAVTCVRDDRACLSDRLFALETRPPP